MSHASHWRDEAERCDEQLTKALTRVAALQAALRELVALKDIKDELGFPSANRVPEMLGRMRIDYEVRKPKAWAAARALLSQ